MYRSTWSGVFCCWRSTRDRVPSPSALYSKTEVHFLASWASFWGNRIWRRYHCPWYPAGMKERAYTCSESNPSFCVDNNKINGLLSYYAQRMILSPFSISVISLTWVKKVNGIALELMSARVRCIERTAIEWMRASRGTLPFYEAKKKQTVRKSVASRCLPVAVTSLLTQPFAFT